MLLPNASQPCHASSNPFRIRSSVLPSSLTKPVISVVNATRRLIIKVSSIAPGRPVRDNRYSACSCIQLIRDLDDLQFERRNKKGVSGVREIERDLKTKGA